MRHRVTGVTQDANGVTVLSLVGRVVLGEESNQLRTKLKELAGALG